MLRSDSSETFAQNYRVVNRINSGNFGSVKKAIITSNKTREGEYVALKEVDKEDSQSDEMLDAFWNEVKILEKVLHPNVIRTYEVYDLEKTVIFVMEYCAGGEYLDKVKRTGEPLGLQETGDMVLAVLGALSFLHFKGISHRDLKPDNVLRDQLGAVKVADFGMANVYKATKAAWFRKGMKGRCGTPGFWAPEVCESGAYTEKCDMWSLGVIAYYACSGGSLPFPITSANEYGVPEDASEVSRLHMPKQCCDKSQALIRLLLKHEPSERPSAREAVNVPFIKEIIDAENDTKSLVTEELLEDLWDFVMAWPLTQVFGFAAARHLHISRVPEIDWLRRGFNHLDRGRDGFVSVRSILEAMKLAPFLTPENDLKRAQKCFENFGIAAGSKPGCVDWSVFLATRAVKHRHSMQSAYSIIGGKPDGVAVQVLEDLFKSVTVPIPPDANLLPPSLRGRRADSIVMEDELLEALSIRHTKDTTPADQTPIESYLTNVHNVESCAKPRRCCHCARRERVTPTSP